MIEFLTAQPAADQDRIAALLAGEAVEMSIMLKLDFANEALFLSNRNIPFVDAKWGHTWAAGSGLLVGIADVQGGDDQLAPFREYSLGVPNEWIDKEGWAADLVEMVLDKPNYRGRDSGLYGHLFDDGAPIGHPFAFDVGVMDKMSVAFVQGGAVVSLTTEGMLARKGVPVYGMQTYFDQKRRYAGDEGMQFTTEFNKLIVATDW